MKVSFRDTVAATANNELRKLTVHFALQSTPPKKMRVIAGRIALSDALRQGKWKIEKQ